MSGRVSHQVPGSSIVAMRWSLLRPAFLAALMVGVIVVLGLHIVKPMPGLDVPDGYWPWPLGLMAYPVTAYLLLSRRPDNRIGHDLGLVALFSGLIFLSHWTAVTFTALSAASGLLTWVGSRGQFGALAALLHLLPTGHPLGARHRRLLNGLTMGLVTATAGVVLSRMPLVLSGETNPHAVLPAAATVAVDLSDLLLAAFAGSGLVALVLRRRASVLVRMQLRWFVEAACIALPFLVLEGLAEIPVAEVLLSARFAAGVFDDVTRDLLGLVAATMQPSTANVWLPEGRRGFQNEGRRVTLRDLPNTHGSGPVTLAQELLDTEGTDDRP